MRNDDDDADRHRIIRDGERVRVPMQFMDSMQREIADARHRIKTVHRDPQGRQLGSFETEVDHDDDDRRHSDSMLSDAELALHRPGYRTLTRINDDEAVAAYRQYCADQDNAWRKPAGAYPLSAGTGNPCTINGAPGVLVKEGDWLVCKPVSNSTDTVPTGPIYDAAEANRIKEAAWREMCAVQDQAWRRR